MRCSALLLICGLLLCSPSLAQQPNEQRFSVIFTAPSSWSVTSGECAPQAVACASWSDSRSVDGWTRLRVVVNKDSPLSTSQKMYGAGYVEGYITQHLIWAAYYNFANGTGLPMTQPMVSLVNKQNAWMATNVAAKGAVDEYWQQLGYVLQQWQGLVDGYAAAAPASERLTALQLNAYALQFEIGDYAAASGMSKSHAFYTHTMTGRRRLMGEHCSSIVKVAPNSRDLLASHVTWSAFNTMLRTYKHYELPTATTQFSSFPGLPFSGDDFVMNANRLVIMETTNEIFNMSLYQYLTEQTVPYWVRVQLANSARTGAEWHSIFSRYNNGGYNNQWIIVDYKQFSPNAAPLPGALVVGEQVPGFYVVQDQTAWLNQNGYWASYNVPFYPFIWNVSGYPAMYKQYGNAYSWSECARAQIYRRDHSRVVDLQTLKQLQRYNQWQTDPLALKDACRGISARCDLNSPYWNVNNTLNGYSAFGAIDAKVTNARLVTDMSSEAVCGPTWDSQPIFWWSNAWDAVPHKELPLIYNFDFVEMW